MTSIPQQAPTSGFGLTLTDKAAEEVQKFITAEQVPAETAGLRVSVLPGGCSGFKYSLNIDHVTSMQGSGFTFSNPNATGGCGCGSSFTA
jgi:Fe-S cluster assembly iron-binding protein IscA